MKKPTLNLLLIGDNAADAALLTKELTDSSAGPFIITHVSRLGDALHRIRDQRFDAVVLDLGLPDSQGVAMLEQLHRQIPRAVPIVVLTGSGDDAARIKAIPQGAADYLVKGASAGEMRARAIFAAIERKRASEALLTSEQQLTLAVDAADLGIFDWNLATGQITWSYHHAQLFGLPPGQLETTFDAVERCIHPDDRPGMQEAIKKSAAVHGEFGYEYRVIWPDGSEHWIKSRGKTFDDDRGIPIRIMGIVMDISRRKAAEESASARMRESMHLSQAKITPRELTVLKLMADGLPSKRIASRMNISVNTVSRHRASLMAKTKALNVAHLTRMITVADLFPAA
jgi:PAS domain S-box-containing protein